MQVGGYEEPGGPGYHGGNVTGTGGGNGTSVGPINFDNSQLITIDVVLGIANICLLLILLYMYIGSYRKFKSEFTFGLVAFAMLLLLQNALFTGFLLLHEGFKGPGMGSPIFFLNIIEFFALSVLIGVTRE
ncbi:hypothetical protein [Methanobacterium sp.]|uniref:hypothetical protein n=1 Tax=Methanobacterium sp. TaxID=2164 RepID=UPI0025F481B6|nr:hypothetical protein [Methanobacterium sp.]MBI5459647.1 hypothetical protein [Methanobacterium sp.]